MNRTHLLLLLSILFITPALHAQEKISFGKITPEELLMTRYEADSTANALVLYEKGNASIDRDGYDKVRLTFERHVRVKIFNDQGFGEATVQIPLYKSVSDPTEKEVLDKVEAIIVNPDRSFGRISEKDIFYEDRRENLKVATFTLPNVQEGCVIEYRYTVKSPFLYNFQPWAFQSHIPKRYSEFHTSIPANYDYNIKLYGPLKLTSIKTDLKRKCFEFPTLGSADCSVKRYIMEDIPAFTEEKYMTSKHNYLSAMRYEMKTFQHFNGVTKHYTKSWEAVDKELKGEDFGRESNKEGWFKNQLPEALVSAPANEEKAKQIFELVREKLYWNGKYDQPFKTFSVKDTWKEGSGSGLAINMVLLNALKAGGFEAYPMLVSTRDNGFPAEDIPAITDFNAMIVKLDLNGKSYLLDAAGKYLPFGMIRSNLLNGKGRVVDFRNESYWYPLIQENAYSKNAFQASIDLTEGTAKVREISSGYYALEKREEIAEMSAEAIEDELANTLEKRGDFTLLSLENEGTEEADKAMVTSYELELNRDASSDQLLLNPFILNAYSTNPFKLVTRTYPVDFGFPFSQHYMIMIDLGEDYVLEHKPADRNIALPGNIGKLLYSVQDNGGSLLVNLQMDIYDPLIAPAHYEALKAFFNEFVSLQNKNPLTLRRQLKDVSENAGK